MSEFGITYTLTTPGGTITFNPSPSNQDGLYLSDVQGIDGGAVRGSVVPLAQRDGAFVFNSLRDAAYPTLSGFSRAATLATRTTLFDNLMQACDSIRPADGTLSWTPSGSTARSLTVRLIGPVQVSSGAGILKSFQVQLVAASPFPVGGASVAGVSSLALLGGALAFPFTFPFTFGDQSAGTATITPGGNHDSFPVLVLTGPLSSPIFTNQTTGKLLSLPGLFVAAGSTLTVDMLNQTIDLNVAGNSQIRFMDVAASDFWALSAGVANQVRVSGGNSDVPTSCQITWRPSWVA